MEMCRKMATAPCGAVALRCQAADPGIARKPGGGNLVGDVILHGNHKKASSHAMCTQKHKKCICERGGGWWRGRRSRKMCRPTHSAACGFVVLSTPSRAGWHG